VGQEKHERPGDGKRDDVQERQPAHRVPFQQHPGGSVTGDRSNDGECNQDRHLQRVARSRLAWTWEIPWIVRIAMIIPAMKSLARNPAWVNA